MIFVAESAFVGLLLRADRENLVILDGLFWLFFGIAMAVGFHGGILGLSLSNTLVIALKQALNGITNALLAGFIITLFHPVRGFLSFIRVPRGFSLRDVVFYIIVAFVLIPSIFAVVLQARTTRSTVENEVQRSLADAGEASEAAIESYFTALSGAQDSVVDVWESDQMENPDSMLKRLVSGMPWDIYSLRILDESGTLLAGYPAVKSIDQLGDTGERELRAEWGMPLEERRVSNVFEMEGNPAPMVSVARPWGRSQGDDSSEPVHGHVVAVVGLTELGEILRRETDSRPVDAAVMDGSGDVVVSTEQRVESGRRFDRFDDYRGNRSIGHGLRILIPDLPVDTPSVRRWEESLYVFEHSIEGFPGWRMVLYSPLGPHREELAFGTLQALGAAAGVLALTIVLAGVLSSFLVRSISQLGSMTRDLPRRILDNENLDWPRSGAREVQQLIENFRGTTDLVHESVQQLQLANAELSKAKHNADAANRAKSRFLAHISHDLRTPLNGILGYAQLLRRDESLGGETMEAVSVIEKSGNHLLELISEILDFSRIEAGREAFESAPFAIAALVEDVLAFARLQAREQGIAVQSMLDEHLPRLLCGDEKKLRKVLMNLLSNAVKFTEEGSVSLAVERAGEKVRFTVSDTGPGIAEEDRQAVFSSFARGSGTDSVGRGGTGLGLAIVKQLVAIMGGSVYLESEVGVGSTFWFDIPLYEAYSKGSSEDGQPEDPADPTDENEAEGDARSIAGTAIDDTRAPDREILEQLLGYARKGDIRSVIKVARSAAESDAATAEYCERVIRLASGFHLGELKELLLRAIKE
ncbi:MAG: sensor histidine kinase [Spirochaetales bacterium]